MQLIAKRHIADESLEAVAQNRHYFSFRLMPDGRGCEMRHGFQPMGRATTISCCMFGG
jgi:hypothetical protein